MKIRVHSIALLALVGCSPPYTIVQVATPNPLVGQRAFTVVPVEYPELRVGEKTEAEYLAEKSPDQRTGWAGDKLALDEQFHGRLERETKRAGIHVGTEPAPWVIHPIVKWLEPGWHGGIVNKAGHAKMMVRITGSDGKVIDEIELDADDTSGTTVRGRMQALGDECGYDTADFIKSHAH
ncbi:MAG: hypothetical protein ACLQBL_23705 [Polyangiaceae bacterium]